MNQIAPVLVTKLDCQTYPEMCARENIRLYPTMRLFVNGKAAGDYNGHRTVLELVHWLIQVESDHRKPEEMMIRKVLDVATKGSVETRKRKPGTKNSSTTGLRCIAGIRRDIPAAN